MDGILGLGTAGSSGLNAEVIEKLKEAENRALVEPLERQIEDWDIEVEQFGEVETKIQELLDAAKKFDLFDSDNNSFEQIFATTTGSSVSFDATDTSKLTPGTIGVNITQLATKDVHASTKTITSRDELVGDGTIDITIDGKMTSIVTNGKTYEDLVAEMKFIGGIDVDLEEVGTDSYRLVIKSQETGIDNALTITGTGAIVDLGIDEIIPAQNMLATVDGIEYNVSSNKIVMQNGLTITALEKGASSVEIQRDTANIEVAFQELITKYNDLVDIVERTTLSEDAEIQDTSSIRSVLSGIKDIFFGATYGAKVPRVDADGNPVLGADGNQIIDSPNKSMFNYGLSLDANGYLSLDSAIFNQAIVDDYDGLKSILVGPAENEGIVTKITRYAGSLDDSTGGLLTSYGDSLARRRDSLETEKDKAITILDNKYSQLAAEFAAYTAIISQFENSFNGLKLLIEQSVAGN